MFLFIALAFVVSAFILYAQFHYAKWERLGFPSIAPTMFIGNLKPVIKRQQSFGLCIYDLYKQSTAPYVGLFLFYRPAILIRDPGLIKQVLSTNFTHFHDRGLYSRPTEDPISDNIFAMEGKRWRTLRAKFTPIFTSGRLKNMLNTMTTTGAVMQQLLAKPADNCEIVDIKDMVNRYSLDVIASVFFGLNVDTLSDPKHSFRTIEKNLRSNGIRSDLVPMLIFLCPKFLELIRLPSLPPIVRRFVMGIISGQIEAREKDGNVRNDFIQFLIRIRNGETIGDADGNSATPTVISEVKTMSIEQCAAQIFIFYVAGFDTSSSLQAYTIWECARNPEVLRKLRDDIDTQMLAHNGQLTYECMNDMKYLDLCIMETVRKYPTLPLLNRVCTKDFEIPGTGHVITEGTAILVSLMGTLRDAQHFPDPMAYNPERFSEQPAQYNADAYIPFGDGPRACIGLRLGRMVAKVGIIRLLEKYDFKLTTDAELDFESFGVTLVVKGDGLKMNVSHRNRAK